MAWKNDRGRLGGAPGWKDEGLRMSLKDAQGGYPLIFSFTKVRDVERVRCRERG